MKVTVLWVIAALELTLWLVGVVTGHTLGGFLHVLLLLAALAAITELGLNYRRVHRQGKKDEAEVSSSRPAA